MTAAADLRERVQIQRLQMLDNGFGGQTESWEALLAVWASVLPTGGRESLEAGALTGVQGWRVAIRWRPGLAGVVTNRFLLRGRPMNIRSIEDPEGSREWLVAFAESGVAQ